MSRSPAPRASVEKTLHSTIEVPGGVEASTDVIEYGGDKAIGVARVRYLKLSVPHDQAHDLVRALRALADALASEASE